MSSDVVAATNQLWQLINFVADGSVETDYYGDDGLPTFSFEFEGIDVSCSVFEGLESGHYATISKIVYFNIELSDYLARWLMEHQPAFARVKVLRLPDGSAHLMAEHDLFMGSLQTEELRGALRELVTRARLLRYQMGAVFGGTPSFDLGT